MNKSHYKLSIIEARNIIIASQQFNTSASKDLKQAILDVITHLGYVQIDTLSVVARAHHHIIWSRNNNYKEPILHELLAEDKSIFEYWSHAASYLPMKDYQFSLFKKKQYSEGKSHWFEQDKKLKKYVLDKIKAEGPLQSKDFEHVRSSPGNWYEWKPAKKALEQLFMEGKLMVARRQGFQKVYDITERVLPSTITTQLPSLREYVVYLIENAIRANGIIELSEIGYLQSNLKTAISRVIQEMIIAEDVIPVEVEGQKNKLYLSSNVIIKKYSNRQHDKQIHILSPFDNILIQRKRIKQLFDFDYNIECYVPEAKRKYGYFCLPVLYENAFVARFDPKADRPTKTFHIKQMHFEKNFKPTEEFTVCFADKLKAFANFNGCDKLLITNAPANWKKELKKFIK